MDGQRKVFHFQELDWIISFPETENLGKKYLHYSVSFLDRKKGNFKDRTYLDEILSSPEFENSFPHTAGFFKESKSKTDQVPSYLEIRIIQSIEEFWKFLNDLNI